LLSPIHSYTKHCICCLPLHIYWIYYYYFSFSLLFLTSGYCFFFSQINAINYIFLILIVIVLLLWGVCKLKPIIIESYTESKESLKITRLRNPIVCSGLFLKQAKAYIYNVYFTSKQYRQQRNTVLPFWCVVYVRQAIKTAARDLVLHGIVSQSKRPSIINGVRFYDCCNNINLLGEIS
jgi:hypothetical protein